MLKQLPNIITISRIIIAISLLFILEHQILLLSLYLICGLTDILDGYIARRYKLTTILGARLDSLADMVMFVVVFAVLVNWFKWTILVIAFALGIALIRFMNIIIGLIIHKRLVLIHTIMNKITGLILFLLPLLLTVWYSNTLLIIILMIGFIATVEEGIIIFISDKVNADTKHIWDTN